MPEQLLQVMGADHSYGTGPNRVHAVRGVDLSIAAGDRVLVMGPSGSGKTTLLSMIGGLLTPSAGQVLLEGTDIYQLDEKARAAIRLNTIGFIFQSFNLLSALNARENVEVPLRLAGHSVASARERASDLLERLSLSARAEHRPKDLSGGEKQRVAIARALANQADLLLADEPTANLDSTNGHQVAEVLCKLGCEEGKAVLIVSHDQRLIDIANKVLWLEDGQITEKAVEKN